jgi:alkaline phosphatase
MYSLILPAKFSPLNFLYLKLETRYRFFFLTMVILHLVAFYPVISFSQPADPSLHGKNVILVIGDGMGFNAALAADFYLGKKLAWEGFPFSMAVATYPASADDNSPTDQMRGKSSVGYDPVAAWNDTAYLRIGATESSAAATAMATGFKTYNKSIGMGMKSDTLRNLVEIAKSLGKSAGVVTTVPFSHATPAGFVTHNRSRSEYKEIARDMILKSRCDVIMGTGNPAFDNNGLPLVKKWETTKYVGDSALWVQLVKGSGNQTRFVFERRDYTVKDCNGDGFPDPWTVVQSLDGFRKLENGNTPVRVLGCPGVHSSLQVSRKMEKGETKDSSPFATPFVKTVPTLAEMALGALNVLDNNPKGFFLMIEGGAIDWAEHDNQKGRTIEEVEDLDAAVKAVIAWVNSHSNWEETIVIVTADHETGYLWGGLPFMPIGDKGRGKLPAMKFNAPDHTNSLVPLFAKGAGSELLINSASGSDPVRGPYIQNTDIPLAIKKLWAVN